MFNDPHTGVALAVIARVEFAADDRGMATWGVIDFGRARKELDVTDVDGLAAERDGPGDRKSGPPATAMSGDQKNEKKAG